MQLILRIKAVLLLAAGLLALARREKAARLLRRISAALKGISIRKDFNQLLSATFPREDRLIWISLGLVTLGGLAIRLLQVDRPVDYDEAYTFIHFVSKPLRTILTDYSAPNNHIFHSLLASVAFHLFGNHLWSLRLTALLAGTLTIPAVYMAGRVFYGRGAALLAAGLVALAPRLVDYSANARGYTLVCLFACLLLWLAGIIRQRGSFSAWCMLVLLSALGFYTLPVMVYPVSSVFLWLLLSGLVSENTSGNRKRFLLSFTAASVFTIFLTFALYSPVIFFGTGLTSLVGNEFVQSLNWRDFTQTIAVRLPRIWEDWNYYVPGWISGLCVTGFALNLVLEWRAHKRYIPPFIPAVVAISSLLVIQKVAPWPRVWTFLLVYFLLWSAAGWASMLKLVYHRIVTLESARPATWIAIPLLVAAVFIIAARHPMLNPDGEASTRDAARFIAGEITDRDTLVAVSPYTIEVGYYLTQKGVTFDRFYDKARREPVEHGILFFQEGSKFPSLQAVLEFQGLQETLDSEKAELVYQVKRIRVYSIPVR